MPGVSKMIFRIIKCAILAFYRKIIVTKRSMYLIYGVAFVIMGQGIGNFIVGIFPDSVCCHSIDH